MEKILTPEQYHVLRREKRELTGLSQENFYLNKEKGVTNCALVAMNCSPLI